MGARWDLKCVGTDEELTTARRFVHDIYVAAGIILPSPIGVRERIWDTIDGTKMFIACQETQPVGVISITRDSPEYGLPSDLRFSNELDELRGDGLVSEVGNLAIAHGIRGVGLLFDLATRCGEQAVEWDCRYMFIAVSPRHVKFFSRVLGFEPCGAARSYSDELTDIVEGMVVDFW